MGIMLAILLLPGAAWAEDLDTVAELKKELEQQRQQTELLLQRINELDWKLREQEMSSNCRTCNTNRGSTRCGTCCGN